MKTWLLTASALAGGMALAGAAHAQDVPPATPDSAAAANAVDTTAGEAIIVTGTRLRRPNLESTAPITTVTGEEFFETGQVSVGDVLNELPQLRSTFSQQNSTRFLGTRGLNLVDLRGLGTLRTLVLVNGRRHVGGDLLSNAVSPDINTIPTDLIESVDIITGGGGAIYGSDAIAGAVNFKLKQSYDGIQIRGQTGVSKYKDGGNQYVSIVAGQNFAEGRGNIAANVEYAHQGRYYGSQRKALRQADAFVTIATDPAGSPNGAAGGPDRVFLRDIRSTTISLGGQLGLAQSRANPRCGADSTGAPFTCAFLFQPDGTLIPQTGQRVGLGPNGSFLGGNGYSGREGQLVTLSPDLERISVNVLGHFEVSPAFVPFFEAKYVRADAFGSQSGPFFNQGTGTIENSSVQLGFNRERVRLDNPFLSAQARTLLTQQILAAGVDPNSTATTPAALTAAQIAQINNGSFRVALRKNFLEFGIRDEQFRRETYRGVVGVRGEFNDDWNYEVSVNYGEHREKNAIQSNINRQRYLLAIDTTRNAAGQIVCRSQVDPTAAGTDRGGNAAQLARDVAACVPLNPFGENVSSQAVRDYLAVSSNARGYIKQFVANGFVSGDTSQLFELPGGPIAVSIGGEYRREEVFYDLDDFTQAGYAFYNAIPALTPPNAFKVKEAFGEISIPILKDVPFFQELTLDGSGRISDYNGATGTVYTYGGAVTWRPIRDLRLRGTYNRAIRAPNLSELYSAQSQNFTPAPNDPCSARNLASGSSTRAANCAAAGRPANYDFVYTSSLEIISGGNPLLREEKSDNYTVGGVFTPSFVPGLSLSVDYYQITVKDVIGSVGVQDILNQCYDQATLQNPFCASFQRAGAGGGPNGEIPFQILSRSLLVSSLNYAKLRARGIDTVFNYRRDLGFGIANVEARWTHVLQRDNFLNPADPNRANRVLGELGDPKDQVNVNASFSAGKVTFGYQFRWIGKQFLNTAEDQLSIQGRPPENTDYADVKKFGNVFYHDIRFDLAVTEKLNMYVGVDNVLNRFPPFGVTGIASGIDNGTGSGGSGIYDVRGRYMYIGAVAKF